MDRHKNGFAKLERSGKTLHGPRTLLLCGFSNEVQTEFKSLLNSLELSELPLVWAVDSDKDTRVGELVRSPDGRGAGQVSALPRAVIAAGIEQQELHRLIQGSRRCGMQPLLWAVLTPASENWPLSELLSALAAEAKSMARMRAAKPAP